MEWLIIIIFTLSFIFVLSKRSRLSSKPETLEFQTSRKYCHCGKKLGKTGRSANVQFYTRNGSFLAKHNELRYIQFYAHQIIK